MKEEDILKLVKQAFEEEISSIAYDTILGLESEILGIKEFYDNLSLKLEELFNKNGLSK